MMKRIYQIAIFSLAISLCAGGCKQSDVDDEQLLVNANYVTFEAQINDVTTRASDSSFEEGDQISVTAYYENGSALKSNALYTYSDDLFSSDSAIVYPERGDELSFIALYPYMEVTDKKAEFTVKANQSVDDGYTLSDVMSSAVESTTSILPTLTFNHLMTKIIINVATVNLGDVTSASTTLHAIPSATLDLTDGSSTLSSNTSSDIVMANNGNGVDSFKAIIPAQSIEANATMATITINGVGYPLQYPVTQSYEQGTQYTYSATVSDGEVTFELSAITPWEQDVIAWEVNDAGQKVYRVANLEDMMPYFEQDSVYVILKQGTYQVDGDDMTSTFTKTINIDAETTYTRALFLVEGNYSTYDFNNSTININIAEVYSITGSARQDFYPLHFLGNWNTVMNYNQVDDGAEEDYPSSGCTNVVMDGTYNTVYNIEVHSKGSFPYGYGENFGKGTSYIIQHLKHCAILVRGNYNLVDYCRFYHRAFGHASFMQGSWCATIRNSYFEGEMVRTDYILSDDRTLSNGNMKRAKDVNFYTDWGYQVPSGYTMSLIEDCLRTYATGNTMVNGVRYTSRTTSGSYVHDNIVKHCRSGIALTLGGDSSVTVDKGKLGITANGEYFAPPEWYLTAGTGYKCAERIVALGCDNGFSTGNGDYITDCYADSQHGTTLLMSYDTDYGITANITLLPFKLDNTADLYAGFEDYHTPHNYCGTNGSGQIAFIRGTGHNITFNYQESYSFTQAGITVSGDVNNSLYGWSRDNEPLTINLGGDLRTVGNVYVAIGDMDVDEINSWFGTSYTEAPVTSYNTTDLLVLDGNGDPIYRDENDPCKTTTITNNSHLIGYSPYKIVLGRDQDEVYGNSISTLNGEADIDRNGNEISSNTVTTLGN